MPPKSPIPPPAPPQKSVNGTNKNSRFLHGTTMTLGELRKLQADFDTRMGRTGKRKRDQKTGDPFPSPLLIAEVSRLLTLHTPATIADAMRIAPDSLDRILRGESVVKLAIARAEALVFPSPAQRAELLRLRSSPQDVCGAAVQIQQNLVKKGWAKFLDAAGNETDAAAKALTAQITEEGKRAVDLKPEKRRSKREPSASYLGTLPSLRVTPCARSNG